MFIQGVEWKHHFFARPDSSLETRAMQRELYATLSTPTPGRATEETQTDALSIRFSRPYFTAAYRAERSVSVTIADFIISMLISFNQAH